MEHGGIHAARALKQAGVEMIFALPGGHIMPLFDGAGREALPLVDVRHEENAVLMAAGWALATGRPAVGAVTAGPGLTNALPGMAEANASGIPTVVLAGRTGLNQRNRGAVQDVDQLALVTPVTKWQAQCLESAAIPALVAEAVHQARSGAPGVAYLEIPQDVFSVETDIPDGVTPTGHDPSLPRSVPTGADVERAVEMLAGAQRPAVLAGSGAFFSGAEKALVHFAERSGLPVITTAAARGLIDDDHPLCLGGLIHGGVALVSADVSLILGSRFNANLVYGGPPLFSPDQQVIQLDVRPEHTGGRRRPALALAGDVSAALDALTEAWTAPADRFSGWTADAKGAAAASRTGWEAETERPAPGGIHPGWAARVTAQFADEIGATFVSDGGDAVIWGIAFGRAHRPGTHSFIGSAMGTLGVGLPFALGARSARPGEPVVLWTGDGAFGLSAIELDTSARHHLPAIVVVANNGGWGDVRHEHRMRYGDQSDEPTVPSGMRYDLLAEAVGGHGERVTDPAELRPALERSMRAGEEGRPAVVDVLTDPEVMSDFMRNMSALSLM